MRNANAIVLAGVLAGCGGSSSSPDGAGGDGAVADGLSRCTDAAPPRALLVAITADDVVKLFALTPGHLQATGITVTGISKPEEIAMRDDGAEAVVAWGGFGSPFGIATIDVAPDGSMAKLGQMLQLGTDRTPMSIAYADHDHVVVALAGVNDDVLGLARGASGFAAGPRAAAPADYPLQVVGVPGKQEVLMSRSQIGVDNTLDVYRLRPQGDGTWTSSGPHAAVPDQPLSLALHPTGSMLYAPTGDPAKPVTSNNLDAPGIVHAVRVGANDFTDAGTMPLPRVGSLIAAEPGGHFIVIDGNNYVADNNGNPNVVGYAWQTVRLGTDGALADTFPATTPTDGLLFDDFKVAPNGSLVAMREMYEGSVPPAMQYPLELWAQPSWGAWELCETAYLSGGAKVAVAP